VRIGLLVHAKTSKKSLVDMLFNEGLSISYKRVEEIQGAVTKQICSQYNEDGIICPQTLIPGLFTTAAIDNIDHNPSSSTAKSSFHGTGISIFQHPENNELETLRFKINNSDQYPAKPTLPPQYTTVMPSKSGKPEYPKKPSSLLHESYINTCPLQSGEEWLRSLRMPNEYFEKNERISFGGIRTNQRYICHASAVN
jgi:hypothetical protein